MAKKKVALIGTNGIPAHYGGIETLAEYLARDLNEDYDLYCYCSKTPKEKQLKSYRNTRLIYSRWKANGWQSILFDGSTILQSLRKHDVLVVLGCSCPFVMPLKKLTRKGVVYNSIGGREADKVRGWKSLGKLELAIKRTFGRWAVKSSDYIIIDNAANIERFENQYGFTPILAEYGGDHAVAEPITEDAAKKYPFLKGKYDVTVSRAQEDMNIHMVIDAYKHVHERTVVIVSNWQKTEYGRRLYEEYSGKFPNIILQNAIYNQKELNIIRSNASLYLHTHSMCGTAPSLVEAMYLGLPCICFKVPTNLETAEGKAIYFESVPELVSVLRSLNGEKLSGLRLEMKEIANRRYNWKRISNIYKDCIDKCIMP